MIPIGDDNSSRTVTPFVNYILIAINIFVFIYYQAWGSNEVIVMSLAAVPLEILTGADITTHGLLTTPVPVHATLITSMFMHGSIAHLAGNMLYLWVFGDNLENVMGHFKYFLFYICCGVLATLSHVLLAAVWNNGLLIPSLGASGAISGVLGGYLVLFPQNRIKVWMFFFFIIRVPAIITLGIWIAMQVLSQYNALGGSIESGGVAYAAHIGGFIAGMILVKFFSRTKSSAY